jgi:hypothetical protein
MVADKSRHFKLGRVKNMSLFVLKRALFASFVIIMPLLDNSTVLRDTINKGHITAEWQKRPIL